jgi:hypothetical protein
VFTKIVVNASTLATAPLDELLEGPVDRRTNVWNILVEVYSGNSAFANAFRGEFKLL